MLLSDAQASQRVSALRWSGAMQLQAQQARLQAALDDWCRAWAAPAVEVQCANAWDMQAAADMNWQHVQVARFGPLGWLGSVGSSHRPAAAMAALLFGASAGSGALDADSPTLARTIGEEAWRALGEALSDAVGASNDMSVGATAGGPPPEDLQPWSGAMRARLGFASNAASTWLLHFRAGLPLTSTTGAPGRPAPAGFGTTESLLAALQACRFPLHAHLRGLTVSLADLMALQQGDVLLTHHPLSAPLGLVAADGCSSVFSAYLAQRHAHMALVLCADSHPSLASVFPQPSFELSDSTPMQPHQPAGASPAEAPSAQWISLPEVGQLSSSAVSLQPQSNPLLGVKAELQVRVGSAVMTVGELTQAQVGQVVKLDRVVDGLVDLLLEGRVVARGQLVAVDDCFGVRLIELPQPLGMSSASKA